MVSAKKTVLDAFLQYNDLITGGVKAPGNLADISENRNGYWPSFD